MNRLQTSGAPFVRSILHPTDFSEESESAFAHALAIALIRKTKLTLFHVCSEGSKKRVWTEFPSVRNTLERWGFLEKGTPRSAIFKDLGIKVKKVNVLNHNPLESVLDYTDDNQTDLIVMATHGHEGILDALRGSVTERVLRQSPCPVLAVPVN